MDIHGYRTHDGKQPRRFAIASFDGQTTPPVNTTQAVFVWELVDLLIIFIVLASAITNTAVGATLVLTNVVASSNSVPLSTSLTSQLPNLRVVCWTL